MAGTLPGVAERPSGDGYEAPFVARGAEHQSQHAIRVVVLGDAVELEGQVDPAVALAAGPHNELHHARRGIEGLVRGLGAKRS